MKTKINLLSYILLFLLFSFNSFADTAFLKKMEDSFSSVAEKSSDAVVFIKVEKKVGTNYSFSQGKNFNDPFDLFNDDFLKRFFGHPHNRRQRKKPGKQFQEMGQGSGFIVSKDGHILTNSHVVGEADKITVKLNNNKEYEAELIGSDSQTDVAVIKISADKDLPFIEMGNSDKLKVGSWVLAVGNPFGLSHTVTAGIVSATGRSNVGIAEYEDFIQTDAAINPGNSGGPLLNLEGKAVGINTAIFSRSGGYMGIGFAIPIDMAGKVFSQLVDKGKVTRGYLGIAIQGLDENLKQSFNIKQDNGILISEVSEGSPADKGGLKAGDVIIGLDGEDVINTGDFRNTISLIKPGTEITLTVIRDEKNINIKFPVGKKETEEQHFSSDLAGKTGFQVQTLTPEIAAQLNIPSIGGVVVTEVDPSSTAAKMGIRSGTIILAVNRQKVTDIKTYKKLITSASDSVLLLVKQGKMTRFMVLELKD